MRDRLLIRHFLQRFLDHDLISPHADRREVLTITGAMLVVSSLFVAFFLAVKYQFNLFLPPGLTSLVSLDDRFLLASLAMIVMALVAVAQWDALALDARDTAVLGPLPIDRSSIVRAKFAAIALFAAGFDAALGFGPTLMRAVALPVKLPVTMVGGFRLTLAQAICSLSAGAFGFIAVLAVREATRALAGPIRFSRISAGLQATLVVFLTTMLLLLPRSYSSVGAKWLAHGRVAPVAVPPLWFVGLHETLAGKVIDGLPRAAPPRRYLAAERQATELYQSLWPIFHRLADAAVLAMAIVLVVAVAACAWNNRRLPTEIVKTDNRRRRIARALARLAGSIVVRGREAQAGFFFTLQTLARSAPHRVAMAAATAVALSLVVITTGGIDATHAYASTALPVSVFALQTLVLAVALTAFRHVVRVPAEVRAAWTFHLSWSGDERPYLAGVKRAAHIAIVAPALLLLFGYNAFILGLPFALAHMTIGFLVALILLDALFIGYRRLPFASSYVRSEDLKTVGPLYIVAALILTTLFGRLERVALARTTTTLVLIAVLLLTAAIVHAFDTVRRRLRIPIDLDERPTGATQHLELVR